MAAHFKIIRNGNNFSCTMDGGKQFFVGRRVPYEGNIGLYNIFGGSKLEKLNFSSGDFTGTFNFWAEFVEPTALCEGRNFLTLNTYDRAAFTFGFGQFAAHVPNGDFVSYFRTLLGLPDASVYFPNLGVEDGRICSIDGPKPKPLENDDTTKPLMTYLNPDLDEVQDSEVIAAAKFIAWTSASVEAREVQVGQMVDTYKGFMARADRRVGIDGRPASQCCVIADILHHGRGGKMTWPLIEEAVRTTNPLAALLKIGMPKWKTRIETLTAALKARPQFETKVWSRVEGDFV